MFYYLSFLRPPPSESSLSSSVTFTPQICNDLRTEYYGHQTDVFYAWTCQPASKSSTASTSNAQLSLNHPSTPAVSPFNKLTTWYGKSSAYKTISIPPPPRVRDGESWALILSCDSNPSQRLSLSLIDLCQDSRTVDHGQRGKFVNDSVHTDTVIDLGSVPFPVVSLPIKFLRSPNSTGRSGHSSSKSRSKSSGATAAPKQEQIQRQYRIAIKKCPNIGGSVIYDTADGRPIVDSITCEGLLTITEQTSFDLDKVRLCVSQPFLGLCF
jgi:hypothetical protein